MPFGKAGMMNKESSGPKNMLSEKDDSNDFQAVVDAVIPKKKGERLLRRLGEFLETVLIAAILFSIINLMTARVRVENVSMQPNLFDGELMIVNRLAYRWSEPQRGDIIVFYYPLNPEKRYVKRIIGLPMDHIEVHDGQTYANGYLIDEPFLAEKPTYTGEWTVDSDSVFVLGDNRNDSSDSKNWGTVPISEIVGKAILVYWPWDSAGNIPHYDLSTSGED